MVDNGPKPAAGQAAEPPKGQGVLERCFLFRPLDERSKQELVARAHRRTFAAGERIFEAGSPGQSMMAVLSGTVRISILTAKGKEIVLADLSAGEVFGEMALLDGKDRSADATALGKCDLLVLERREVLPFLRSHPDVCLTLLELLSLRLRRLDERMADIAFVDLPARLAKTLLRSAQPAQPNRPPRLSLSQSDLAKMIGGTRETVNRCLADWQRQGLIELKGGWTVLLKPEAIEELSAG